MGIAKFLETRIRATRNLLWFWTSVQSTLSPTSRGSASRHSFHYFCLPRSFCISSAWPPRSHIITSSSPSGIDLALQQVRARSLPPPTFTNPRSCVASYCPSVHRAPGFVALA
ncbi:hypothetical protein BDR03DRAFT_589987 [Suillus americanus]|nr:hypothetical protein BDR03DRAFT_589987 [Suillus americanus]